MHQARTSEAALQGGSANDQMNQASASLSDHFDGVYAAPKPDQLGKWRRKTMRNFKRDDAYNSLHPKVKKTIGRVVMGHMNPRDGYFQRQAKLADELGVSIKTVNRHLKKAVERELFTCQGKMYTKTWRGVNTYRVHPRFIGG